MAHEECLHILLVEKDSNTSMPTNCLETLEGMLSFQLELMHLAILDGRLLK
jgi:hypothetical protein